MNRQVITFEAGESQELKRTSPLQTFAVGTVRYIESHFQLPPSWRTFTKLYAIWFDDYGWKTETLIDETGVVIIPADMVKRPGVLYVNLCGCNLQNGQLVGCWTSYVETALRLKHTKI